MDSAECLAKVPLFRLAGRAQILARSGEITGETALALIVWPDQDEMRRYVATVRVAAAREARQPLAFSEAA